MSSETTKTPTCGRCRYCRWTRGNRDTGTCYLTRVPVRTAADASQCANYTEPIIAPEDLQKGYYGDDEGRVYCVTAICKDVNYLVIGKDCSFEGCLRLDPSGAYMGPMPRESLACRVTHRLETPELVWRPVEDNPVLADLVFTCYGGCTHAVNFPRKDMTASEICEVVTEQTGVPATMKDGALVAIDTMFHRGPTTVSVSE